MRLLFEDGLYAKSWVCKTRKSGLAHANESKTWHWDCSTIISNVKTFDMRKAVGFSPTSTTRPLFSIRGFYTSAAYVQLEFGESAASILPKTIGNRKRDCAWRCAGVKKLKKNQLLSTNHQNPYLLRLVMICAQQLIFLQFFNTRASSRTIPFSISNSFWY